MKDFKNINEYFLRYLKLYISTLTEGKEEFFLSLCDIEEEFFHDLDISRLSKWRVTVVDNRDYSKAVRLRNDIRIKKIILLSGEGIKQIDSLKDFNEYPILPRNRTMLWDCLSKVFQVDLERSIESFIETILDNKEIAFSELFKYFYASIENGKVDLTKLNGNLDILGIWKSKSDKILNKGRIEKMIRTSKSTIVESRLTKAITENRMKDLGGKNSISTLLSQGNIQKILETYYYEDVEAYFKNTVRNTRPNEENESSNEMEVLYATSYEYKLLEQIDDDISDIESEWLRDKNDEEIEAEFELTWKDYEFSDHMQEDFLKQVSKLKEMIQNVDLTNLKMEQLLEKLENVKKYFLDNWEGVRATPSCLYTFCLKSEGYVQEYIELLCLILLDDKIRLKLTGTQVIINLLLLWCEKKDGEISMPFYHPIAAFHYMSLQKIYENIVRNQDVGSINYLKTRIQVAAAQKVGMQFPVEFLESDGRLYRVDYTTVNKVGKVIFRDMLSGLGYSVLDFRIIQGQVIDYIKKHPFLTEINVAVLDIGDLNGLLQLASKIRECSISDDYNVSRVTFRILSAQEDELKKSLAQMLESIGTDDIVRFRFGRYGYQNKSRDSLKNNTAGKKADLAELKEIIEEADLTILSDSSILYYEPKMVSNKIGNNMIMKRLEHVDIRAQLEDYFSNSNCDIPYLWDTLQHIAIEQDEGFWCWKSRAINNQTISLINQVISDDIEKAIVVLSSNADIISEINKTKYIQALRRKYNGKSINILNFSGRNGIERLDSEGEVFSYSVKNLYNEALDLEEIHQYILPEAKDIILTIQIKDGIMHCHCNICSDDGLDTADVMRGTQLEQPGLLVGDEKKRCTEWIEWQFGDFFRQDNIISRYCQELWINQWYEEAYSVPAVLLVERLCRGNEVKVRFGQNIELDHKRTDRTDCMEAVKIHDIIGFVQDKVTVDERTISQFFERFEATLLERIIRCDETHHLLNSKESEILTGIYERVREI